MRFVLEIHIGVDRGASLPSWTCSETNLTPLENLMIRSRAREEFFAFSARSDYDSTPADRLRVNMVVGQRMMLAP